MLGQVKQYAKYHNKLLTQKKITTWDKFEVHPYIVDEQTLTKKLKQPKFVKHLKEAGMQHGMDYLPQVTDSMYAEGFFRYVCSKRSIGKCPEKKKRQTAILFYNTRH